MKLLVGIAILLGLILVFVFFMSCHTAELSENLLKSLFLIEQNVKQEKWREALQESEVLKELWERADSWWTPFMDHREIELLEQSIIRVASWVDVRSKENTLVEIKVARRMVQSIQMKERPSFRNIF